MGRGRKRKPGERYPSGGLKPRKPAVPPALWGRIRDFTDDPILKSELFRLSLLDELTDTQTAAGLTLGRLYRRYRKLGQLLEGDPASDHQADSHRSKIRIAWTHQNGTDSAAKAEKIAWQSIENELDVAPCSLREAIIDLCVDDKAINPTLYADVRRFLDRMAQKFEQYWLCCCPIDFEMQLPPPRKSPATSTPEFFDEEVVQVAFEQTMAKLRPDLSSEDLTRLAEMFLASCHREDYRAEKALAHASGAGTGLDAA